jgi:hypothetical protein
MVEIPCDVEVLGSYFTDHEDLKSLSFEKYSQLQRMEAWAFANSRLQHIVIPPLANFIDASAFLRLFSSPISIDCQSDIFQFSENLIINSIHQVLIRNLWN